MSEPTAEQRAAALALDVSLDFGESPKTIARLVEVVERLQRRVEALEEQKTGASSWSLRRK